MGSLPEVTDVNTRDNNFLSSLLGSLLSRLYQGFDARIARIATSERYRTISAIVIASILHLKEVTSTIATRTRWLESLDFLCLHTMMGMKSLPVTQLHVFPYSERPGTAALKIPYVVSDKDKKLRSKRLLELSDEKTQAFYAQYIGTEAEVLFEKAPRGKAMHGFTKNYVRVELSPALAKEEYDNQLIKVKLGDFNHDKTALKAELI